MSFLANYWWALLLPTIIALWLWRASRRVAEFDEHDIAARAVRAQDPTPTPWRAADVAARFALLRRRERRAFGILLAALLFGAVFIIPRFVPEISYRGALYIAAFVGFAVLSLWRLRHVRIVRDRHLNCPLCNGEQTPALVYDGKCSDCHAWLLHPNELQPAPPSPVTAGSPLRNAVGQVVLLGLTWWGIAQTARLVARNREDCVRRYAAARTAADTARLDALRACRGVRRRI